MPSLGSSPGRRGAAAGPVSRSPLRLLAALTTYVAARQRVQRGGGEPVVARPGDRPQLNGTGSHGRHGGGGPRGRSSRWSSFWKGTGPSQRQPLAGPQWRWAKAGQAVRRPAAEHRRGRRCRRRWRGNCAARSPARPSRSTAPAAHRECGTRRGCQSRSLSPVAADAGTGSPSPTSDRRGAPVTATTASLLEPQRQPAERHLEAGGARLVADQAVGQPQAGRRRRRRWRERRGAPGLAGRDPGSW